MNIFVLDEDPRQAARWHNDAHCVKMILETAQLLCTAQHLSGNSAPYKPTHVNHPCSVWTRQSRENYIWLCVLGLELCKEYTERYKKTHACERVLKDLYKNVPNNLPSGGLTPFALAMPDQYKNFDDPVGSYRNYYQTKREGKLGTWKQNRPFWWLS